MGIGYDKGGDGYHGADDERNAQNEWGSVSDISVAAFSGLLLFATIIQIVLWRRANKTAEEALIEAKAANTETRRSVDAFVEAERGRMIFERFEWHPSGLLYHVAFRNVGRSVAVVRGFRVLFNDEITPYVSGGFEGFVRPGKRIITGTDEAAIASAFYPVPVSVAKAIMGLQPVSVTFNLLYEGLGGVLFQLNHGFHLEMEEGMLVASGEVSMEVPIPKELAGDILYQGDGLAYVQRIVAEQSAWEGRAKG